MAGIVRLCRYGSQTATPKAINAPCAYGIASLVSGMKLEALQKAQILGKSHLSPTANRSPCSSI